MTQEFAPLKSVAVLGCGPAGLLAAHGVGMAGQPLSIHSLPQRSTPSGAQFLHSAIPGLTDTEGHYRIKYELRGTALGYRKKVYGIDDPTTMPDFVSFDNVQDGQMQSVWDLGLVYEDLWQAFGFAINEAAITAEWLEQHMNEFRMVISTIPKPMLCRDRGKHKFTFQVVHIDPTPPAHVPQNVIIYNGDESPGWYRASRIGDAGGVEYSDRVPRPPGVELVSIQKPIRTDCDCWDDSPVPVVFAGRYGAWRKGVLVDDAFRDAFEAAGSLR